MSDGSVAPEKLQEMNAWIRAASGGEMDPDAAQYVAYAGGGGAAEDDAGGGGAAGSAAAAGVAAGAAAPSLEARAAALRERHDVLMLQIAPMMKDGARTPEGDEALGYFNKVLKVQQDRKRSPVILGFIDMVRKGDQSAVATATRLLGGAHDHILLYNRAEAAAVKGPSFGEIEVGTVEFVAKDFQRAAQDAKDLYERLRHEHKTLAAILDTGLKLYETAKPVLTAIDFCTDFSEWVATVGEQEAVAAGSVVLGPVGPGAVQLTLVTEVVGMIAMFLNAVAELSVFIEKLCGVDPSAAEHAHKGLEAAERVTTALQPLKEIQKKLDTMKKVLDGLGSGCSKLASLGAKLHTILHHRKA